ncbi:LOW QUALITY PROTEIN: vomeronasal type-1 receptor 1-like [Trichosurus vulpecula]|uniref:LOW QUALITY PROTEIN: vomeronasal type-1 receptor 1-like n=1 Tax=Trichosurus vulpecula TaxID=9337 RepID=UPI00186B2A22|nr:LOW QUALITY PROTEIN: vomeronasal type-1 receptor 1-like [Trichosurus vulpecula]
MTFNEMVLGLLLLFQTGFGALGNSFLLGLYTITFFTGPSLRPIDLLLCHLAFVNDLVLLSKGIPQTLSAFGLNNFLDDVGCKLLFYLHRVARGLSLSTTCLLSGFQAITLSPRSSRGAEVKIRKPQFLVSFCFLCWTFHLLTHHIILLEVKGPTRMKNITETNNLIYCSAPIGISFNVPLYLFIFSLPDVLCVGIMVGTSGYLVFVLYRHHQKVQYIRSNNHTPHSSPEIRATQTILLLVSMFVSFYSLNTILTLFMLFGTLTSWLAHINVFLGACFPACSPFVLIVSDSQVPSTLLLCGTEKSIECNNILKIYS